MELFRWALKLPTDSIHTPNANTAEAIHRNATYLTPIALTQIKSIKVSYIDAIDLRQLQWLLNSRSPRRSSLLTSTAVVGDLRAWRNPRCPIQSPNNDIAASQMRSLPSSSTPATATHAPALRARMSPNASCHPSTAASTGSCSTATSAYARARISSCRTT